MGGTENGKVRCLPLARLFATLADESVIVIQCKERPHVAKMSLTERRTQTLGSGAELFYDQPLEIVRGEGVYLYDRGGRAYLDMYNNVQCVGHANTAVVNAMAEQQATLNVHSRYLHEGIVHFGERLAGLNHDGIQSVVFSCSGTEANEVALQIARIATGRRGIICTDAAYHGNSELVDSLTYLWRNMPTSGDIRAFPTPDCYRPIKDNVSEDELCDAYLDEIQRTIDNLNAEGSGLAALIICPIFANEGMPYIPAGFMSAMTDLVHKHGGLVIADEVQSGYARTGKWWGYEKTGFRPDIVVTGKPMGNGLPLAATAAPKEHVDAFRKKKDYFNTCSASPLQAAVGMTVLDEIERLNLLQNASDVGTHLTKELIARMPAHETMGDVRGYGLFVSIDMIKNAKTKAPDPDLTHLICNRLKDAGFLLGSQGKYDNVLKIRPPLVFSKQNADDFLGAFDTCMETLGG